MVPSCHLHTTRTQLATKAFCPIQALVYWLTLVFFLTLTGCASQPKNHDGNKKPAPPKPVQLNAFYTNTALNFHMKFDESWYFFTEDPIKKSHNANEPLTIESSANNRQVATISRFSPGKPSQFNDNITVTAEEMTRYPNVRTSSDYLSLLKDTLKRTQTGINFENLYTTELNTIDYAVLPMSYNIYGIKIHQSHYVTLREGKIIDFILTYAVRNRKPDLLSMLNSVRFIDKP
jgi:hypothetical protein